MFEIVITSAMLAIIVYLMVSLGGIFSERSGVVNIALDGEMIFGGFAYIITTILLYPYIGDYAQIVGWIAAIVAGGLIGLVHAFASITLGGNQIISGLAINLFAGALTMFIIKALMNVNNLQDPSTVFKLGWLPIPIILAVIVIIASSVFINKTKTGKRMVATGENPNAIASLGLSVFKLRYLGVILSGFAAALGGAFFIQTIASGRFEGTTNGLGFISIAIMIVGQWRIKGIVLGSLLFGLISAIATNSPAIPGINKIPSEVWMMIPFIGTIGIMILTSKNTKVPKASGQPYDQGKR